MVQGKKTKASKSQTTIVPGPDGRSQTGEELRTANSSHEEVLVIGWPSSPDSNLSESSSRGEDNQHQHHRQEERDQPLQPGKEGVHRDVAQS